MTINNKDDYEKLAKILYPSIEASGNVYYGQTRKLTMDEILGKNKLNFESHIETFKQGDQTYKSYFNWKIGPLKGAIQVKALDNTGKVTLDNFPNTNYFTLLNYDGSTTQIADIDKDIHGTVFAKYKISHVENPVANVISSASFTTYENSFYTEYIGLYIADSNLVVTDNKYFLFNDDCNFFITRDNNNSYLYIKVISRKIKSCYKNYIDKPFRITNVHNSTVVITLFTNSGVLPNDRFKYRLNGSEWLNCSSSYDTSISLVKPGSYVELKINSDAVDSHVLKFSVNNDNPVAISGNILSLYYSNFSTIDYSSNYFDSDFFINAFKNNHSIVDASKLSIPCQLSTNASFAYMFYGCTQLKYPPELPSVSVSENCYESMFCGCISLEYVPDLSHVLELQNGCFNYMFDSCTTVEYPQDVLPATSLPYRCYYHMYSGCTSLKRTPLILGTSTSGQQCLANMFDGCTSLKMVSIALSALGTITVYHWLYNVSENGTIFVIPSFNEESSQNHIPQNWTINRIDFTNLTYYNDNNGFYCDEYSSNEPLANSDLIVSGSDCELNGRGILSDETKFNMLETSPLISDNIEFGKYDPNSGSLNQEIWGIKSFNSPILFRNGIYGECASLTTADISGVSDFYLAYENEYYDEVAVAQNSAAELKVLPNDDFFKPDYNPRSLIEVLHTNTGNTDVDAFKMSVCQSGLYAYNKFDDTNKIRYIDPIVNELNNVPFTGKYASFVSSASLGTNIIDGSGTFDGRNEHYISVMSAGDAIAKLEHINNTSLISVTADTINILPRVTNNSFIGSNEDKFDSVYANNLFGCIPCPNCTGILAYPELEVGSIVLISLYPSSSIAINGFTSEAYKNLNIPLTFKAFDASTVLLKDLTNSYLYSINNAPFEEYPEYNMINLSKGDTVAFKNTSDAKPTAGFDITGNVSVYGNIHSMLNSNFENILSLSSYGNGTFEFLFENCNGISDASGLALPANTLTDDCYFGLFKNCTNLKKGCMTGSSAARRSHYSMFENCTSLTTVYRVCTVNAAHECYCKMFKDCTSLQTAPEISINSLFDSCCKQMFEGCTSLKVAPVLCTDVLAQDCYKWMFKDCINLQLVKCLATQSAYSADQEWLQNTYSSGKIIFKDGLHAYVNASLPTPNNWSTSLVTDNKFSNVHILPGSIIRPGCIFTLDYTSVLTPTNSEIQNRLGTLEKLGEISIAAITSENNGSISVSIDNSTIGLFSDCTFKLLSGCVCNNTPGYALAMRVE